MTGTFDVLPHSGRKDSLCPVEPIYLVEEILTVTVTWDPGVGTCVHQPRLSLMQGQWLVWSFWLICPIAGRVALARTSTLSRQSRGPGSSVVRGRVLGCVHIFQPLKT